MSKSYEGYLLIADITGYTMYLSQSELDHAQEILSALLKLLLNHTRPPLLVSRLAGDAVISYGLRDNFFQSQVFIEVIEDTYVAFRKAIDLMALNNTCGCAAFRNISTLDLKFFVHYGEFAVQHISDHDELVGSEVNKIHRLLKNHVSETTGIRAYVLYTDAAIDQLAMEEIEQGMLHIVEQYEHLGTVGVWVQDLEPTWEQRKKTDQFIIPPENVMLSIQTDLAMTPELVWNYITLPKYMEILNGVNKIEPVGKQHGRVTTGSGYTCYHGENEATDLTILEWQPFERLLTISLLPMPIPNVHLLVDLILTPNNHGTHLAQIISIDKKSPIVLTAVRLMLSSMKKKWESDMQAFKTAAETDMATRLAGATINASDMTIDPV